MTDPVIEFLNGLVAAHPGAVIACSVLAGTLLGIVTALLNGGRRK